MSALTGAMGLSATNNPLQMTFTNGSQSTDGKGFGVLNITNDHPLTFEATASYINLSLGSIQDYFDVDEGVAVTVMRDGSYAFVAGRDSRGNAGTSIYPDKREGGNIGIIKDPLGNNPQLVAATRPIPGSLTNNVVLSFDDKYLMASYPTLGLDGAVYVFDVEEMVETISTLELRANGEDGDELEVYWLDSRNRGEGSVAFDSGSKRSATFGDLVRVPIDDINPDISIAADYEIIGGNWVNQFTYGVPSGTQRSPLGIGGNPTGLASVSVRDWVELLPVSDSGVADTLNPTFEWDFKIKGENEEDESNDLMAIDPTEVEGVNLYVSVFPEGEGLLPTDRWSGLENPVPGEDYNRNRVLTAEWNRENQTWSWNGGSSVSEGSSLPQELTLPEELRLTGGQTYYWAVEVVGKNGTEDVVTGEFETPLGATGGSDAFSSVTVLTNGVEPGNTTDTLESINDIAKQIEASGAAVMRYQPSSQKWESVSYSKGSGEWNPTNEPPELGKPLVLLADWVNESNVDGYRSAGIAEAAADGLFSSLVDLDFKYGGTVGGDSLYDEKGNLIRSQGALFNSPLHFIGFGQGAVVNTEIVQRLGTYFPTAGGFDAENRDLHFTTVDAFEYTPETVPQFEDTYARMLDPNIVIWDNVTYADNYYQLQGSEGDEKVIKGKLLTEADNNQELEKWAGFDPTKASDNAHRAAVSWYGGTANLNQSYIPSEKQQVFRRFGDLLAEDLGSDESWFVPGHIKADFAHGDENAPWEGIGTGWFYSVNGGGDGLRSYFDNGEKKSRDDLGDFKDYLKENRRSVSYDNTYVSEDVGNRLLGDFAVPTLFNGNFDVVAPGTVNSNQAIAGWSLENDEPSVASLDSLVDWKQITSLKKPFNNGKKEIPGTSFLDRMGISSDPNYRPNYALKLEEGNSITHNPFIVPDWGTLRFNLHVPPEVANNNQNGKLKVTLQDVDSQEEITETILLSPTNLTSGKGDSFYNTDINLDANRKLGYGTRGFEAFHVFDTFYSGLEEQKELEKFRGKTTILKFELEETNSDVEVYLDDVFFKSANLRFGQPTPKDGSSLAKYSGAAFNDNPFRDKLLLEKPQYTLSYNGDSNIPNWASFQINKSWIHLEEEPSSNNRSRVNDRSLPPDFYQVTNTDYNSRSPYARGHLTPIASRSLTLKDNKAVNMMSNFIPQHGKNNQPIWEEIENYAQDFVKAGREVYVITGIHQIKQKDGKDDVLPPKNPSKQPIKIPQNLWKAMLVLERPNAAVSDSTENIYAVGFYVANELPTDKEENWKENWQEEKKEDRIVWSLEELEEHLQYDLFPHLPPNIKKAIEKNREILDSAEM